MTNEMKNAIILGKTFELTQLEKKKKFQRSYIPVKILKPLGYRYLREGPIS